MIRPQLGVAPTEISLRAHSRALLFLLAVGCASLFVAAGTSLVWITFSFETPTVSGWLLALDADDPRLQNRCTSIRRGPRGTPRVYLPPRGQSPGRRIKRQRAEQPLFNPRALLHLPQQQTPGVRGGFSTIKPRPYLPLPSAMKFTRFLLKPCGQNPVLVRW